MKIAKGVVLYLLIQVLPLMLCAQKKGEELPTVKYRRSSLHMVLVPSGSQDPNLKIVDETFFKTPFPDKYNDHRIALGTLERSKYPITEADRVAAGTNKTKGGKLAASAVSSQTAGMNDPTAADVPLQIDKFIAQTKLANALVAKWYGRNQDGGFDMALIGERGLYDASALDQDIAKGAVKGNALLADAGEELIGKTFVVFNKMHFVENEPIAAKAKEIALMAASKIPNALAQSASKAAAEVAYLATKEGYTVMTTSYLYKLDWNDSIANIFYTDLWMNKGTVDEVRKKAFDESNLFSLSYIGATKASNVIMLGMIASETKKKAGIEKVTARNIDEVYAKLQKEYEVFKPMTPLHSIDPATARIGMKEGLAGGEKFEVLEQTIDPKTSKTIYKRKGVITVEKDKVWDNRISELVSPSATAHMTEEERIEYMVEQALSGVKPVEAAPTDVTPQTDAEKAAIALGATTFKGGSKLYPGILIRQMK